MAQINNEKSTTTNEISLKEVILKFREWRKYLWSKWKIILIPGLLGGILGLTYSFKAKPNYIAELTFALQDNGSSAGNLGAAFGLASQLGVDLGNNAGGAFTGDNLLALMQSRSMVESTLLTPVEIGGKNQTLAELYIAFNNLEDQWKGTELQNVHFLPNLNRSQFTLKQDSVLWSFYKTIIKKNLEVGKVDKTQSLNTIKVTSHNEQFSYHFTEILVRTVSDFYITSKTKKSTQNVNVLQRQTDSVRRELNSAITGVASTSDINPNPNPSLQIIRVPSLRRQVDVQANTAILTELVKNLELSKIALRKETPLIQLIDRPILPLEKKRTGKILPFLVGTFLASFLTTMYLLGRKMLSDVMKNDTKR